MFRFALSAAFAALVAWLSVNEARDRGLITSEAAQVAVAGVVGALAFRCIK